MDTTRDIENFFNKHPQWKDALVTLHNLIRETGLQDSIKWGIPVYTLDNKNLIGLGAFKSYFGLWFYQGVFLEDKHQVLINAQDGKTKAMRQWRFTNSNEINLAQVKTYVEETIRNQKSGKEIKPDRSKPLQIPALLIKEFAADPDFHEKFEKMSLSCKREYSTYIDEAKRPETKVRRLKKIIPMIMASKGLHDQYKRNSTKKS